MKAYFVKAQEELSNTKAIAGSAMLTALQVILDFFRIVISNMFEISFSFLAIGLAGMLYGPIMGAITGGVGDILAYIVRPSGIFFPGFTLSNMVSGFIYGCFMYRKEVTLKRVAFAVLTENLIVHLILTPIWLNFLYGSALFASIRIVKAIVLLPINVFMFYTMCKLTKTLSYIQSKS